MSEAGSACVVCGHAPLAPHLHVQASEGHSLVATTTSYGAAPDDIVRCTVCGHMQVASFPETAQLDSEYGDVDEAAYVEEETGQRATAARVLERIERHTPPARLCDLGCWVGFLPSEAERRGWQARGAEPSRFASRYARDQLGLDVVTGTMDAPELDGAQFDAVFLGDVIEHLPEPPAALDRIRSLLAPGGVLCLALPDAGSRIARVLGARWWSVLPTHVQYFTRRSMARLLTDNGFTVEWIGTAPKGFTVRYYLTRLEGYSAAVAGAAVRVAEALGLADRLVWPDFRDRMLVVARRVDT
ncbi:MAG TPA: class I SAM-dependent methyltransferase [Thermoleophilaceae bacterium]|nr:class I SAM-dependent methyltransferase [Thermoleophilaceae bacterium]